jgi:hypothetical protein
VPLAPDQAAIVTVPARGDLESLEDGFGPGISVLRGRTQLERNPNVTVPPTRRSRAIEVAVAVSTM